MDKYLSIKNTTLTSIADAIRAKTNKTDSIYVSDMANEISNIESEINLQDKTITENGEYTSDAGFDGLGKVLVNIASGGGGVFKFKDLNKSVNGSLVTGNTSGITFDHYCRCVPDMIIVVPSVFTNGHLKFAIGYSSAMMKKFNDSVKSKVSKMTNTTGSSTGYTSGIGFDADLSGTSYLNYGGIRADETTITFGSASNQLDASTSYDVYIWYGITE